ncbi:hypothetical protein [Halostella litorea]|uniref:hypothetical protein n=1 Tax=Halostella litorea TaxID=2528831 RepID=UPI0010932C27|nr:hypothetical protein [Halostella litorea]
MPQVEDRRLPLIQTVVPKYRTGSIEVTPKPALDAAGIGPGWSLFFQSETDGVLVAVGVDRKVDGRSYPDASPVQQRGRFIVPESYHDVLGIDPESVRDDGGRLSVYADDGVIALRAADELDVTVFKDEVPE